MRTKITVKNLSFLFFFSLVASVSFAQNVGIGTSTPAEKLHVAGTMRVDDLQTPTAAVTTTDKIVWVDANGKVYALPSGTPGRVLGLNGAGVLSWLNAGLANSLNDGQIWIGDASNAPVANTPSGDALISNTGVITIQDDAVDGTDITITGESNGSLMYFDGTHWVNIGIGSAGQVLAIVAGVPTWVNATALIEVENGLYYNAIAGKVRQGGVLVENTTIPQGNFDMIYDMTGTGNFEVRKAGVTDVFVSGTSGNVGIGIATPTAFLDITGTSAGTNSLLLRSGNISVGTASNQILFGYSGSDTYRHAIKTRHNSGAKSQNAIDFYLWNTGVDLATDIATKPVMTIDGNSRGMVGVGTTGPRSEVHISDASSSLKTVNDDGNYGASLLITDNAVPRIYFENAGQGANKKLMDISLLGQSLSIGSLNDTGSSWDRQYILSAHRDGNVSVGFAGAANKLDVLGGGGRSGTHATGRALYVTGTYGPASNGVEFRHDNGTQGIGFGYNTIYATGSNANQDLGINALGTGVVSLQTGGNERVRVVAGGSTTNGKLEVWGGYLDNVVTPNYTTLETPGIRNLRVSDNFSVSENIAVGFPYTQHKMQVVGTQSLSNMVDQYTTNSGSWWVPNAGSRWQSFTAGQTGSWTELRLGWLGGSGTTTLNIYSGEGNGGALLSTFTITKAAGLQTYVLPTPIAVTGGNQYTFEVMDISGQLYVGTQNNGGIYSGNAGGDWWFEIILATGISSAFTVMGGPNNGNVGIHTSTPNRAVLELNDAVGNTSAIFGGNMFGMSLVSSWPGIYFNSYFNGGNRAISSGFSGNISLDPNGGRFIFTTGSNVAKDAVSATNERMTILNNGNVGIGTTAPDQLLSVNGDASKIGGGVWATFSDKRVKQNIQPFSDGLNVLMNINPVSFQYNGLGGYPANGKNYIGVIAQEIQPIAPYMVETVAKKLNPEDEENTNLLMYDASAMTYIMANAIKEQQKQIADQQAQIRLLMDRLQSIELMLSPPAKPANTPVANPIKMEPFVPNNIYKLDNTSNSNQALDQVTPIGWE